jgi:hypothetical protein
MSDSLNFFSDDLLGVADDHAAINHRTPQNGWTAGLRWEESSERIELQEDGAGWIMHTGETFPAPLITMGYGDSDTAPAANPLSYYIDLVWQSPNDPWQTGGGSAPVFQIELFGVSTDDGTTQHSIIFKIDKPTDDGDGFLVSMYRVGDEINGTLNSPTLLGKAVLYTIRIMVNQEVSPSQMTLEFASYNTNVTAAWSGKFDLRRMQVSLAPYSFLRSIGLTGTFIDSGQDGDIAPNLQIKAMNPSHIIYECLTNRQWGRGLPVSSLDMTSFEDAAQELFNENFGLCMKWARTDDIATFVQSILDHIGGALFQDRTTTLMTLKLIRADYLKSDLPLYTVNNGIIAITDATVAAASILTNEVVVTYHDPVSDEDRTVNAQNLASLQASGGAFVSLPKAYPGIPTPELAARVAQRDLRVNAIGLRKFTIKMDRRGWKLQPGAPLRIEDVSRKIPDMVVRIGRIEDGTLLDGSVTITAVQDVFSMPAASYTSIQPVNHVPPNFQPCIGRHEVFELPYFMVYRATTPADLANFDDTSAFIGTVVERGQSMNTGYQLAIRTSAPTDEDWPTNDDLFCGYVLPPDHGGPGGDFPVEGSVRALRVVYSTSGSGDDKMKVNGSVVSYSGAVFDTYGELRGGEMVEVGNPDVTVGPTSAPWAVLYIVQQYVLGTWVGYLDAHPLGSASMGASSAWAFMGYGPAVDLGLAVPGMYVYLATAWTDDAPVRFNVNDGTSDVFFVDTKVRIATEDVLQVTPTNLVACDFPTAAYGPYSVPLTIVGHAELGGIWSECTTGVVPSFSGPVTSRAAITNPTIAPSCDFTVPMSTRNVTRDNTPGVDQVTTSATVQTTLVLSFGPQGAGVNCQTPSIDGGPNVDSDSYADGMYVNGSDDPWFGPPVRVRYEALNHRITWATGDTTIEAP